MEVSGGTAPSSLAMVPRRVGNKKHRSTTTSAKTRLLHRDVTTSSTAEDAAVTGPSAAQPSKDVSDIGIPSAARDDPASNAIRYPANVLLQMTVTLRPDLEKEGSQAEPLHLSTKVESKLRQRLERAQSHTVDYVSFLHASEASSIPSRESSTQRPALECIVRTHNTSSALALLSAFPSSTVFNSQAAVQVRRIRLLSRSDQESYWKHVPLRVRNKAISRSKRSR